MSDQHFSLVEKISESLMAENIINTRPMQLFSSKTGLGASYMVSHSERTSYQISSSFRLGGCLTNKQLQLNNSVETRIICQEQNRQCRPNFTIWTKFRNIFTRIIIIVAISWKPLSWRNQGLVGDILVAAFVRELKVAAIQNFGILLKILCTKRFLFGLKS